MSPIVSLSDVGYRQFGPLPATGGGLDANQVAATATQCRDYEAAGPWLRRRARRKGDRFDHSFEIIDVLDRDGDPTDERLGFVDDYFRDYFRSKFANASVPRLSTDDLNLLRLVESAATERCRSRACTAWGRPLPTPGRNGSGPYCATTSLLFLPAPPRGQGRRHSLQRRA